MLTNRKGSFIAFGFEAEQEYGQALEDDDEPDMLMFRHFKMMLHKREVRHYAAKSISYHTITLYSLIC